MEFGVVGLGRIGGGLSLQALGRGHRVVGYDPHPEPGMLERLTSAGIERTQSLPGMVVAMKAPRVVFLYVHAGALVDQVSDELAALLTEGDVIVDGGNSYWGDSSRRQQRYLEQGIHFVDLGTSGGLPGAEHGACFMMGGHPDAKALVAPIVQDLCTPGGFVDAGEPGSGHFVKLVHNGIEFGMLQAIGEGVDVLERFGRNLPIADVIGCWRNGSVIRSWLIDLMHEAYLDENGLDPTPGYVEDTGEVNWLVADALHMEVPIPAISQSVNQLFASRDEGRNWARAIALMRRGFGGHQTGPQPALAQERATSRVGDYHRSEPSTG